MDNLTLFHALDKHITQDVVPSEFIESIFDEFTQHPFDMLQKLKSTEQSPIHHPEGNVWNHTLLVVDEAAKLKEKSNCPRVFMWAALLHDIGKPSTTKVRKGKITSYDHDKVGAKLAKEFLLSFTDDMNFINDVCSLIKFHMQILFVVKNLPFADLKSMKQHTDIEEVALLGLADRLGRRNVDLEKEQENIRIFIQKCNK